VQTLCELLSVSHPKLLPVRFGELALRDRFDALLSAKPGSAVVFARLFDLMETPSGRRHQPTKRRRG